MRGSMRCCMYGGKEASKRASEPFFRKTISGQRGRREVFVFFEGLFFAEGHTTKHR